MYITEYDCTIVYYSGCIMYGVITITGHDNDLIHGTIHDTDTIMAATINDIN